MSWFAFRHAVKTHPYLGPVGAIAGVLGVGVLVFGYNLGDIGLIDETEPLFAEAARQMVVTGDWIAPQFNNEPRFDKPPLVYWLMAIGYQILGVNEWAVRLPSALSAIALMLLVFYTCWRFFPSDRGPEKFAFCAATLSSLNFLAIVWGRTGVSDMLLSGCMGGALLCFFLGYASSVGAVGAKGLRPRPRPFLETEKGSTPLTPTSNWYLLFYVLIGLAILAKGPVGIVLPGLIVGSFLLYLGKFWEVVREMKVWRGLLVIAAIAVPWYILITLSRGETYIDSFFGYHNFERFTRVVNEHSAPWYFYFAVVLLGFFPWSVYLPSAIVRLKFWQRRRWKQQPRSQHLGLFAFFWFAGIFLFFTVAATKLPSYVLPLIPAAAILVALVLAETSNRDRAASPQENRSLAIAHGFNIGVSLLLAIAFFTLPAWLGYDPAAPELDKVLPASGLMAGAGIVWGAIAAICEFLLLSKQTKWIGSVSWIGFVVFVVVTVHPMYVLVDEQRQLPLRQLATLATEVKLPGEDLIQIGVKKPSLVFYTREPVVFAPSPSQAVAHVYSHLDAGAPSVLIIAQPDRFRRIGLDDRDYELLGKVRAYRLVRAQKQAIHLPEED